MICMKLVNKIKNQKTHIYTSEVLGF